MIRRHFFLIAAVAVVVLMVVAGALRLAVPHKTEAAGGPGGGRGGKGGGGAAVTLTQLGMRPFADRLEVLGVAKGRQSVTITSNTTELITAVHFRDGQHVGAGQVLVDLKAQEEDAGVVQAQSALALAKLTNDRWQKLAAQGIAPRATADQYAAQYEQAKATLAAAQSRKLDRVIRAPFAGVVGLSDVAPGTLINPGSAIASLDDISVIRVDFDVPDRFLAQLHQGQPITATTDAFPSETFAGRISQLDTRINVGTRTIKARAELPNPGGRLKPGMMIRVGVQQGVHQGVAAPEPAIAFENDRAFVYKLGKRGDKTVAQQVPVELGVRESGWIEITSGAAAGDKVIADGLNRVQPGQPVRLAGKGGQGGPGGGRAAGGQGSGKPARGPAQ